MTTWEVATLETLCAEGGGFVRTGPFGSQLHRSDYVDDAGAIPVVMPKDMIDGRVDQSSVARIDTETAERLAHHLVVPGDVILSRRGDVGRSVSIRPADIASLVGTGSIRIHLGTPERMNPRYFEYFMRSRHVVDYLEGQAVGATMPNLNAGIVNSLPVFIPPLGHQGNAANVLGAIDDLIENNRRRIEVLEEMAQAIYREWFVHFRYPGHEDATFVDSPLGPIPEGWEVHRASDALTINPRTKSLKDVEDPFITMGDLDQRGMVCFPSELKGGTSGSKFVNGDTLFARITPSLENGKTGFVASLGEGQVGRGSTEFVVLRGAMVGPAFTYFLARLDDFRGNAIASMAGASGRQRVRNECFDSYDLAVASPDVLSLYEEAAAPMMEQAFSLTRSNKHLASIRDLLLPKLVTGEIDVSGLDLDALVEAAS